jgi:hypothetical protein
MELNEYLWRGKIDLDEYLWRNRKGKMDLDEYLWRNRVTIRDLAIKIGCTENTLLKIKHRRGSAGLLIAIKIVKCSDGQIALEQLLSKKDVEKYEKWL